MNENFDSFNSVLLVSCLDRLIRHFIVHASDFKCSERN